MASVITFPAGRSFTFTINKRLETNPSKKWNNSYEVVSLASGTLADLVACGQALVQYELYFHTADVRFVDWQVRTGARDSTPYNPETFYQQPIDQVGTVPTRGAGLLDLSITLWVNRAVLTGRLGNLFYRGMLSESDVTGMSGNFALNDAGYWGTRVYQANGFIAQYLSLGTNPVLKLVMIGPNGEFPRPIASFEVNGVSISKKLRRYFDRTPSFELPGPYLDIVVEDVLAQAAAADGVIDPPPTDPPEGPGDPPPGD